MKLDREAFKTTFGEKMIRVAGIENTPFDFWPYFDAIPQGDFGGHDFSYGKVTWVWRSGDGRFEHVLVDAREDTNVFMVIVLDLTQRVVAGHRLLNLNDEYGIDLPSPD